MYYPWCLTFMDIVVQITMKYQVWFAKLVVGDVDEMVDLQPDEALVEYQDD